MKFFVRLCIEITEVDMDARNDIEDQENDPELNGDSYAIEIVLETLASMMVVRSAVIRSRSCELTGLLLTEIPQEYELTLPVSKVAVFLVFNRFAVSLIHF